MFNRRTATVLMLAASIAVASPVHAQSLSHDGKTMTVFAAASLRNALEDANKAFTKATGIKVVASYAASSALAKQIVQGAPAEVYASANIKWMDYLEQKRLIKVGTRVNLLGNALVLIAPVNSKLDKIKIAKGFDIAKLAGSGRIAIANVTAVPAGLYAKAALQSLGAWATVEPRLAQGEHVRATLSYVARAETPLGIVYSTDAKIEPKVKIIGVFPDGSHPPIIYRVAATATARGAAPMRYLEFLQTPAAKAIFEKYGFTFLIKPVT